LFGHEKGSFTGAHTQKKGQFETAHHGTLFLDEIGDLNISMQAKILRALQEREIMRVGGTRPIKVDVRVVAATNRDLEAMVKDGRFREDLYYRLNIIPIVIPPLRNRRDDIPALVDFFIAKHVAGSHRPIRGLTPGARNLIMSYSWPGNVRQLSRQSSGLYFCEGNEIEVETCRLRYVRKGHPPQPSISSSREGSHSMRWEVLITRSNGADQLEHHRSAKLLGFRFARSNTAWKFGIKKASKEQ
jgi:transcriptional regulator with PAS, ATPase and Fis domain